MGLVPSIIDCHFKQHVYCQQKYHDEHIRHRDWIGLLACQRFSDQFLIFSDNIWVWLLISQVGCNDLGCVGSYNDDRLMFIGKHQTMTMKKLVLIGTKYSSFNFRHRVTAAIRD